MSDEKPTATATQETLRKIVQALEEKKAGDLRVLRVSAQSSITDYLVLATGTSEPHLRALRVELEKVLDGDKMRIAGMDSSEGSGWTVVDAYQIMIHLFTPDKRDAYRLEQLWNDAEDIHIPTLLGVAEPVAPAIVAEVSASAPAAGQPTAAAKPVKARKSSGAKPKAQSKPKKVKAKAKAAPKAKKVAKKAAAKPAKVVKKTKAAKPVKKTAKKKTAKPAPAKKKVVKKAAKAAATKKKK